MGIEEYKFKLFTFFGDIAGGIINYIPFQIIVLIILILIYILVVYFPTKIYIKKSRNVKSNDDNILIFIFFSFIYILTTYLSVIIYNYKSIELGTEKFSIGFGISLDNSIMKLNFTSVLIATTLQIIINIVYTNIASIYIRSNLYTKLKHIYMLLFYTMGVFAYFVLTMGYFGFFKGIYFEYDVLKYISYIAMYSTLILYPIFIFRNINKN